ncbi:MAG: hypothetical protein H0V18_09580 [Pyrinomonadaceae bacterium]|nr:hypothetical protein [Pyrinomonadaceae bacterium]
MESETSYVFCVDSGGYQESLEVCKVYAVVPDELAAARQYIRVIDETGEDYLYPAKFFVHIEVPPEAARLLPAGPTPRNSRPR